MPGATRPGMCQRSRRSDVYDQLVITFTSSRSTTCVTAEHQLGQQTVRFAGVAPGFPPTLSLVPVWFGLGAWPKGINDLERRECDRGVTGDVTGDVIRSRGYDHRLARHNACKQRARSPLEACRAPGLASVGGPVVQRPDDCVVRHSCPHHAVSRWVTRQRRSEREGAEGLTRRLTAWFPSPATLRLHGMTPTRAPGRHRSRLPHEPERVNRGPGRRTDASRRRGRRPSRP